MNISLKNDMTFDSFLYFLGLLQLRFQKIRRRWPCPKNMCPHYLVCPMLFIVRPMSVSTKAAKYDCGNGLDQSKKTFLRLLGILMIVTGLSIFLKMFYVIWQTAKEVLGSSIKIFNFP